MAEQKKYYWLKLKRDFFKRHDIRIIEEMPNGKDYILFYLKMLLESIDHEGELRFNETIPYNEQMLSVITNTNIDIVKSAMKIFIDLNMIEILDDSTIYMAEVLKLTGSETAAASRMRKSREKKKALPGCNNRYWRKLRRLTIPLFRRVLCIKTGHLKARLPILERFGRLLRCPQSKENWNQLQIIHRTGPVAFCCCG